MIEVQERPLTPAQRGRLQAIEANDRLSGTGQETRVIAWSERHVGPVICYPDGTRAIITARGRKVPVKD